MTGSASLAEISNTLIFSALLVYVGAFVAYCAEWACGTRSRLGRRAAAAAAGQARTPVLVGAAAAGSLTAPIPDPVTDTDMDTDTAFEEPGGSSGHEAVSPAADVSGRIGVALTVLGFLLHTAATAARGLAVERFPLGNMYEFAIGGALAMAGAFLLMLACHRDRRLGLFVLLPVTLTLGLAITVLYTEAGPLAPALRSYWLGIHVSAAVLSTGAFTLGAIASALYLVHSRMERHPRSRPLLSSALGHLPGPERLDRLAYRAAAFVLPLWTFAILAGAIWAENAWGRYWAWDPKETWAFITWVCYAAYLHSRATAGWKGTRAARVNLIGYGCFVFNFIGVNIFISGLHSYAGL